METILDTLAEWGTKTKDSEVLVEYVRNALRRTICNQYALPDSMGEGRPKLVCVTLDPALEDEINAYIDRGAAGASLTMPARVAKRYAEHMTRSLQLVSQSGHQPVVIASPAVRAMVRQLLEPYVRGVVVLGYNEIVSDVDVQSLALVAPPPPDPSARASAQAAA
jgi:flagellar biosynthesis protein FlhA